MTVAIIVAWLHYIGIMALMAALLGEHLLLKPEPTLPEARTLQRLDLIYGAAATLVLVTGIMRMFLEKGVSFYLHHGAFHILLTLFVVIGLLSIYPTLVFLRWRKTTGAGQAPQLLPGQFKKLQMIIRMEMTLLLLAPLFAAWMVRGFF
jgi:putative membrane protein